VGWLPPTTHQVAVDVARAIIAGMLRELRAEAKASMVFLVMVAEAGTGSSRGARVKEVTVVAVKMIVVKRVLSFIVVL